MKGLVIRNTHMKYMYDSSIFNSLKVMTKVKVFVHAANADLDADADGRAMTNSEDARNKFDLEVGLRLWYQLKRFV